MSKKPKEKSFLERHINSIIITILICLIGSLSLHYYTYYYKDKVLGLKYTRDIKFDDILESDKQIEGYSNVWGLENMVADENGYSITYPKGTYKPSIEPIGGIGFIKKFTQGYSHLKLSYDLKFDEHFDFVKGGKLPGLCGGSCPRGGVIGEPGFSTRFMWRTGGEFEVYAYTPNENGLSIGRGMFTFIPGKFYNISQEIILNTPGENNGKLYIYVDGVKVFSNNEMIFRNSYHENIDGLLFSTFFGGSDESWATPIETKTYMKNFTISY